jgi:hypothetical protein
MHSKLHWRGGCVATIGGLLLTRSKTFLCVRVVTFSYNLPGSRLAMIRGGSSSFTENLKLLMFDCFFLNPI